MKFCWCTITTSNMEESVQFYQEVVQLSLSRRFTARPGVEISFLGDGETQVELICDQNVKAPRNLQGISMGFEVDSLEAMMKVIEEKGLKVDDGPYQPNPHIRFFYVKDPNGVSIQFVENIGE